MASPPCVLTLQERAPNYLHRDHTTARYLHDDVAGGSYASAAWRTLFQWTNETANVWTTIFAFVTVNVLYLISRLFHGAHTPFTLLYLSAAVHLPFSICCSLFVGVSEEARNLWRGLDIFFIFTCAVLRGSGIAWHVLGSTAWKFYMAALLLDWCYCIARVTLRKQMKDIPRKELVWDIAGICTGYTAPMMLATLSDLTHGQAGAATSLTLGTALCLWTSAVVCALHIPERWSPGRFDVFGSHAIMHVLVTVEYVLEWLFVREGALREIGGAILR